MVRRPCAQSMAQLEAACERGKCEEATSKGPEILNINHIPQRDETRLVGLGEMVGILTFTFTFIFRSARRDLGRIRIARNASVASKET